MCEHCQVLESGEERQGYDNERQDWVRCRPPYRQSRRGMSHADLEVWTVTLLKMSWKFLRSGSAPLLHGVRCTWPGPYPESRDPPRLASSENARLDLAHVTRRSRRRLTGVPHPADERGRAKSPAGWDLAYESPLRLARAHTHVPAAERSVGPRT
jgi:hypothetical protein